MTRKEQVKILDDKIKANERQYNLDRINAEISAYSSGDLPKYEYLTKKDLGYKPDAFEQAKFEYSPLGKTFTDGLAKKDKSKKVGLFRRLKNIEDNIVEVDNNDNKVGIFRIIKYIKDKGIKIDSDDEAVREIRECIQEIKDNGIKVNNFDEMKREIIEHVKNLKEQGANVKIDQDQINYLINKIFDKKVEKDKKDDKKDENLKLYIRNIFKKYDNKISISYGDNKLSTEGINLLLNKYNDGLIEYNDLIKGYNEFIADVIKFEDAIKEKKQGAITPNQKKMKNYINELKYIGYYFNPQEGKGLKILSKQQMFSRLPILLAQIQAGNNSKSLKNESRQLIYSLYRSKALTKTVYNLIKVT